MGKISWKSVSSYDIGWYVQSENGSFGDTLPAGATHELERKEGFTSVGFEFSNCSTDKPCPSYAMTVLDPPEGYDVALFVTDVLVGGETKS